VVVVVVCLHIRVGGDRCLTVGGAFAVGFYRRFNLPGPRKVEAGRTRDAIITAGALTWIPFPPHSHLAVGSIRVCTAKVPSNCSTCWSAISIVISSPWSPEPLDCRVFELNFYNVNKIRLDGKNSASDAPNHRQSSAV